MFGRWRAAAAGLRTAAQQTKNNISSSFHTIQAIPREIIGTRVSSRDRAQGRIPAVVFSQLVTSSPNGDVVRSVSRKRLLTTEKKQIQSILNSVQSDFFCSTTFPLQIRAGSGSNVLIESGIVLPVKIHRDGDSGKILNLVFAWAEEGSLMKVDVPVVYKGEDVCPGLRKGGYLNKIRSHLKYLCPAEHIPPKIEVDVSNLDIDDRIFMQDIKVHPSLKLLCKNESMPVCKISITMPSNKEPVK